MLLLLGAATLIIASLTVLSGFGLGTLLTPLVVLFYPVKTAVVSVAFVHAANNLFMLALFRRRVVWRVVLRFGLLSIAGAALGALLLAGAQASAVQVVLGAVLLAAGLAEIWAAGGRTLRLPPWPGVDLALGFLSGLLGGLVGNQGALRAAYLLGTGLVGEPFVATAAAISTAVDATRLPLYLASPQLSRLHTSALALLIACAFAGTYAGRGLLRHLSPEGFRRLVAAALCLAGSLLLGAAFFP